MASGHRDIPHDNIVSLNSHRLQSSEARCVIFVVAPRLLNHMLQEACTLGLEAGEEWVRMAFICPLGNQHFLFRRVLQGWEEHGTYQHIWGCATLCSLPVSGPQFCHLSNRFAVYLKFLLCQSLC